MVGDLALRSSKGIRFLTPKPGVWAKNRMFGTNISSIGETLIPGWPKKPPKMAKNGQKWPFQLPDRCI